MSERVGRENRIVNDNGFGLAAEEADLELVPKLVVNRTRHVFAEPVEPATSLVAMPEAIVSHRQERPVLGQAFSIPGGLRRGQPWLLARQPEGYPGSGTPSRILLALARVRLNYNCTDLKLGDPDVDDAHITRPRR
jgi:hypothetical protein